MYFIPDAGAENEMGAAADAGALGRISLRVAMLEAIHASAASSKSTSRSMRSKRRLPPSSSRRVSKSFPVLQ